MKTMYECASCGKMFKVISAEWVVKAAEAGVSVIWCIQTDDAPASAAFTPHSAV